MKKFSRGFTLVEVLVSMTIFSLIMIIAGAAFVRALDMQRYAFGAQSVQENAAYVLEVIARELRTATIAELPDSDCSTAADPSLTVTNQDGETIVYAGSGADIIRSVNGIPTVMNSNSIQFSEVGFCVLGALIGDLTQPRVTMVARIKTPNVKQQIVADIHTTISLRAISD